ncbi:hypothetical protein HMI54_001591 [Coelomomyces lativittatus]|nr:hypothetical protein HMI54_001591 [Coelomomyces lativittatus]
MYYNRNLKVNFGPESSQVSLSLKPLKTFHTSTHNKHTQNTSTLTIQNQTQNLTRIYTLSSSFSFP